MDYLVKIRSVQTPLNGQFSIGANIFACIFNKIYETGRKVVEGFKESMRIVFDKHLRQWNYVAMPEAAIL